SKIKILPMTGKADITSMFVRQLSLPIALIKYGVPLPIASAPIKTPIAKPRFSRNHVAAIFIAGGYTPARHMPVQNRNAIALAGECEKCASDAVAAPARSDETANK